MITVYAHFVGSIAAMEPCYGKNGGNATRVYTRQGEVYLVERRLKTVLKNLACYYGADTASLRKNYGGAFNSSYDTPLALSQDLVLVPLKTRQPLTKKDGATAYVNACSVKKVLPLDEDKFKCHMELEGSGELRSMFTVATVEERLNRGRLAKKYYCYLRTEYKDQKGASMVMETDHDDIIDKLLTTMGRLFQELLNHKKMIH